MRRNYAANHDGFIAVEILNSSTASHPYLSAGPQYARHKCDLEARMPSQESAYNIATPFGFDPETIRFEAVALVSLVPMPPGVTMLVERASTAQGRIRVTKTEMHAWEQHSSYGLRQAIELHGPSLQPGDWVELHCVSRCYRPKEVWDITPRPDSKQQIPWRAALLIKAKWRPIEVGDHIQTVRGDPLDHLVMSTAAAPPLDTPEPDLTDLFTSGGS